MFDPWAPANSVLREKVVEHLFIAGLSRTLLLDLGMPFEILRSEFDAFGYDLVIECNGVLRHIQLKAMRKSARTAGVDIQLALADKPGGCVIWMAVDPDTLAPGPFRWFGGAPGCPLPALGERSVRHSRAGADGKKKPRPGLRRLTRGQFEAKETFRDIAIALFGLPGTDHDRILLGYIAERALDIEPFASSRLSWSEAGNLASRLDAYALAEAAGLGDPGELASRLRRDAEGTGRWEGSALELAISVCKERLWDRWQSEGAIGMDSTLPSLPLLDELAAAFGKRLQELRQLQEA